VLELLVHVEPADVPDALRLLKIEVPNDLVREELPVTPLPPDWQELPVPLSTRALGDAWLAAGRTPVLVVPAAVLPHERNYLLNPSHADARRIRIVSNEPFAFDPRIFRDAGT
jgi:RES domain-containing protein